MSLSSTRIEATLAALTDRASAAGDLPLKLFEGAPADEKVASMLYSAQAKTLTDGTPIVPGTIIGGRTMLVDADDVYAFYYKDGALWLWGTQRFFRSEYQTAQMDAVVGVEPLVKFAYIEIAFLAGVFEDQNWPQVLDRLW